MCVVVFWTNKTTHTHTSLHFRVRIVLTAFSSVLKVVEYVALKQSLLLLLYYATPSHAIPCLIMR